MDAVISCIFVCTDMPGGHSFWLNDYHYKDKTTSTDDVAIAHYFAFARLAALHAAATTSASCKPTFLNLLEATTFMDNDTFVGVVVSYDVKLGTGSVALEALLEPQQNYLQTSYNNPVADRLGSIEVINSHLLFTEIPIIFLS